MMLKGKTPAVKGPSSSILGAKPLAPVLPVRGAAGRKRITVESSRKELLDSRLYRRTVADHDYWENYLTTDRYFKNMLSLPSSRIIRALSGPLASVASVATIVCTYETLRSQGVLPPEFPSILMPNNTPLQLTSFAVSLLLVFRTNQSYDRWWEARKIWGGVLNRVRDIVTQAVVFIPEDEKELRIGMRNWTIAFTRTLEAHLQGKLVSRDLKSNLENVLSPKELDMVMNSQHKVVKCLSVMAEIALQAPINSIERQMLMGNVQTFYDYLGMCERIMRTPLPLTYTRHTSRFLFFWICSLPFALYSSFGWGCIPVSLVISTLLLGIDEIGVQIEEPFGVLPLDAISARAEIDMRSIVADQPDCANMVREYKPAGSTPPPPRGVPIEARRGGATEDWEERVSRGGTTLQRAMAHPWQQPQLSTATAAATIPVSPAPAAAASSATPAPAAPATVPASNGAPAAAAATPAPAAPATPSAAPAANTNGSAASNGNGAMHFPNHAADAVPAVSSNGNSNGAGHVEDAGSNKVKQAMQAARAQVEKALHVNQRDDAPGAQHHSSSSAHMPQHSSDGISSGGSSGGVGVLDSVQLQQEQLTVAALRSDLAHAHSQLAELSQFLKEGKEGESQQAPQAAQQVLGGQLASQQEEIVRLRSTVEALRQELQFSQKESEQLRVQLTSSRAEMAQMQGLREQMAEREMVMVQMENEIEDLQKSLYDVKVSLSKGLGIPLKGFKNEK